MSFVSFHNHSEYSSLDGLATTDEIIARAVDLGYGSIGISDHGTVAGHVAFSRSASKHDIKPIFAVEAYHGVQSNPKGRDQSHLLCGARTDEGLRNLWRLVDKSASNFFYVPRVTWDTLKEYREGLFVTSACMLGLVSKGIEEENFDDLNRYLDIFRDDFFIELHTYPDEKQERLNQELVAIAQEKGIPTLIANDAHFAYPDQYEVHDAYLAAQVRDNVYMDTNERKMWHPKALYIQSLDDIYSNLSYLPTDVIDEAILNGVDLSMRIDAKLPEVKKHLPMFVPRDCPWLEEKEQEYDAAKLFIELVETGLKDRYGDPSQEVMDRAVKELRVFLKGGLEHYFLQAWDFVQFCDQSGIRRGPGRGSAGGAIVSYALGITDVDPMKYDLKFERFYNPGREKGFPDIDNDFPTGRRTEVRKYMAKRWGDKRVRSIGTVTRMKPKAAIDAFWYVMDVTFTEKENLKAIIGKVPDLDIHGPETVGWDAEIDPGKSIYIEDHVGKEIKDWLAAAPVNRQPILSHWIEVLRVVCCRVQHYGTHPSGTVISDVDLDAELPCRWSTSDKIPVTMFPMNEVEARQFVKQDFLGLRNLDTIEEWESLHGEVDWFGLEDKEHPKEMWEMLDKGLTLGIFQIEDGYARRLCKEIQPRSIEDLAAIVAMNRPGPIRADVPDRFIARRFGLEDVEYDHPILEDILEPTYGLFLYQEQIIEFMGAIGYSESDADEVRKILGKKKPEVMRDFGNGKGEWTGKGYLQMAAAAGVDRNASAIIWDKLEGFASYSFNKSHAVAYATLAFRTLYAKFTGTPEYIIALLRTNPDKAGSYVTEGRKLGINVKAPEIDRSGVETQVVDGEILFGFSNIKHVGVGTAKYICELRDRYDISSPELLFEAMEAEQKVYDESTEKPKKSPKQKFRSHLYTILYDAGCWENFEDRNITLLQRQEHEKELLQVILTDEAHEAFDHNSERLADCHEYSDIDNGVATVSLPGVVASAKEKLTKKDRKKMGIVSIEYEGDDVEFVVFPKQWSQYKFLWRERTPGIFELKKTDRGLHFESGIRLT